MECGRTPTLFHIIFLLAAKFTPKIPPKAEETTIIIPLNSVKREGAASVAIKEIRVKIKNRTAPKIAPSAIPFFFKLLAANSPAKKAPMLSESVEQMLAKSIAKTPKDIKRAQKISNNDMQEVPIIAPKIIALIVLSSKNFLFSKIKTSP